MSLGERIKKGRLNKKLSQAEVAKQLNISRQSISKWENGYNYPDIDNLILLSNIYEISIDELLKEKEKLTEEIVEDNNLTIDKHKKDEDSIANFNTNEGLLLLTISLVSCLLTPLGIFIAIFIFRKNKKANTYYKIVNIICVCSILINIYFSYIILGDWLNWNVQNDVQMIE